jgi:Putative prokaryotic signal transducing protein
MEFTLLITYDNYVPAHIAKGRLEAEGINCWLKDENTVTIDPILTNAVGGIKLMVAKTEAQRAWELLEKDRREFQALSPCPRCGSHNTELVSTPRKASNWASALVGLLLTSFAPPVEKVNHCFDCEFEFK